MTTPTPRLLILIAVLIFLATFVQFGMISIAFDKLGLSQDSAYLLLVATLIGSMINLPLFSVAAEAAARETPQQDVYRLFGLRRPPFRGRTVVAVNVGGALIPLAFSAYLMLHNPLVPSEVLAVVGVVAAAAYFSSSAVPGVGIAIPLLVAPLAAALAAVLFDPEDAAPLAYIGGTLGVLIGADLLRMGEIRKLGAPVASIGGAGTFDGIFLSGLMAVLLA